MRFLINRFKINITLGVAIIALSIMAIYWHQQMHILYEESKKIEKKNQQIIAMQKQLLTEQSQKISGKEIKEKALEYLKMKTPKNIKQITL